MTYDAQVTVNGVALFDQVQLDGAVFGFVSSSQNLLKNSLRVNSDVIAFFVLVRNVHLLAVLDLKSVLQILELNITRHFNDANVIA